MSDLRTLLQDALVDAYTRGHSDGAAGPRVEMQLPEMSEFATAVHAKLVAPLEARIAELEAELEQTGIIADHFIKRVREMEENASEPAQSAAASPPTAHRLSTGWAMDLLNSAFADVEGAAQQAYWEWSPEKRVAFADMVQDNFLHEWTTLDASDEQFAVVGEEALPEPFRPIVGECDGREYVLTGQEPDHGPGMLAMMRANAAREAEAPTVAELTHDLAKTYGQAAVEAAIKEASKNYSWEKVVAKPVSRFGLDWDVISDAKALLDAEAASISDARNVLTPSGNYWRIHPRAVWQNDFGEVFITDGPPPEVAPPEPEPFLKRLAARFGKRGSGRC